MEPLKQLTVKDLLKKLEGADKNLPIFMNVEGKESFYCQTHELLDIDISDKSVNLFNY